MTAINSNRAIRGPVTAVPVVAGKGVRLVADTENNRWVVEADETVLWDGNGTGSTSVSLSETILNFETIKMVYAGAERYGEQLIAEIKPNSYISNYGIALTDWFINSPGTYLVCAMGFYSVSNDGKTLTGDQIKHMWFSVPNMTYSGEGTSGVKLFKIIGINRIASN